MGFKCAIIDDDELDRLVLLSQLRKYPLLEVTGAYDSAEQFLQFAEIKHIEVLFLDVDLPGMSGIELRKKLDIIPACIFISSHPEFAADSYMLDTLDFITKPYTPDRFYITYQRIENYFELKYKAQLYDTTIGGDCFFIKEGHNQTKLKLYDIIYLEALKDYTKIVSVNKNHLVLFSIGNLLKESQFKSFVRIHRSYAVQRNYINSIRTNNLVLQNNVILPIGEKYKTNVDSISA